MKKRKSHAFGKDVYLLGADESGVWYWLEAPSWDCGRYWGFGYVECYTHNKQPHLSRDINSHTHIENFNNKWVERLVDPTFSKEEAYELHTLFLLFYILKKANTKEANEAQIPTVTAQIVEILNPETK